MDSGAPFRCDYPRESQVPEGAQRQRNRFSQEDPQRPAHGALRAEVRSCISASDRFWYQNQRFQRT